MQQHIAFILNLESRGTKRALFSRARLPPRNDAVTSRSVGEALGQRFEDNWALNGQDQETRITLPHPFDACRAWKLLLSSHYSHQPVGCRKRHDVQAAERLVQRRKKPHRLLKSQ
jgi:hypothetical protein